ncbi:MAG: hypothetical protein PF692_14055 [Kiritimatiellae bacterium]|jgi:hypothetical protein|nr:hypothetical protein [Kiritimatiellia bacterium]
MAVSNTAMVLAVVAGPILAVQAQKLIETWRDKRQRKVWVFKTLMATRGTVMSPRHVEALNMIDLEFSGKKPKERAVIDTWRLYLDHLSDGPRDYQDPSYQAKLNTWSIKSQDCLVELLHTMGRVLNYDFDKVQLKKGAYTPQGHTDVEFEQSLIRKGTLELIYRQRALPVEIIPPPVQEG